MTELTELKEIICEKIKEVHEDIAVKTMQFNDPGFQVMSIGDIASKIELECGLEYCRFFYHLFVGLGSTMEEVRDALTQEGISLVVNQEN